MNLKRMWINQPSTQQPHHKLHGQRVLAVLERPWVYRVYFLQGDVISQEMETMALSEGWPRPPIPAPAYALANQGVLMAFARTHDWGHDAKANPDGSITVGANCHHSATGWTREFTTVSTMQELRDWAGS